MDKRIKKIEIEFIPNSMHRYQTSGDWYYKGDTLVILISQCDDPRHEQLLVIHELVEAFCCNNDGVSQKDVDDFDMGVGKELEQPGDDETAPYHKQHVIASNVEFEFAQGMGVDWDDYNENCSIQDI